MPEQFAELLIAGKALREAAGLPATAVRQWDFPGDLEDARGRLPVRDLIRCTERERRSGSLLVLTDRDLSLPGCESLFGFADRRAGVAVISTARLEDPSDPSRLPARLLNESAHELGHLNGLHHCSDPSCVMRPVTEGHELDTRPLTPCARCADRGARRRPSLGLFSMLLAFLGLFLALDRLAPWIGSPPLRMPFT
jgi:archaemetzincin